jgi:hypothetical protein
VSLLSALRAWEQRPSNDQAARDMEAAARAVASSLGVTETVLRERIATNRRSGLPTAEAVREENLR